MNHSQIVSFLWGVADLIWDTFKRGKYQGNPAADGAGWGPTSRIASHLPWPLDDSTCPASGSIR